MAADSPSRLSLGLRVIASILWPPSAPLGIDSVKATRVWWAVACAASAIPITAALHNIVFWRPSCMLNPFGGEYTPSVVIAWLSRDPSLPWAIVLAALAWHLGNVHHVVKLLMAPVFASLLPLSVWIWDIPFSGRVIHYHFHDGRVLLAPGLPLSSRYFYGLGVVMYSGCLVWILRKYRRVERAAVGGGTPPVLEGLPSLRRNQGTNG